MRSTVHLSTGLRGLLVIPLVTLLLLAGCRSHRDALAASPAPDNNPHSVTISWVPSKSAVAGYNVYRVSSSGKIVRLTNGIVSETTYTDHTVAAGQTYSYYVTSVDSKGAESKPSDKITATVPATGTPPASK